MRQLTDIQSKILDYIIKQKEKGLDPSLQDIAEKFGYSYRSSVQTHLQALEKKGYIKRDSKAVGRIYINNRRRLFTTKEVIGEVAAGEPLTIYPDSIDIIELPALARIPDDAFILQVKGDSLKDANIFSGDMVIVNPNLEPLKGHFVVAIIDDSAVVKRYYKKRDRIELHSENPEYKPIIIEKNRTNFKIVGVVTGIYRSMGRRTG